MEITIEGRDSYDYLDLQFAVPLRDHVTELSCNSYITNHPTRVTTQCHS